MLKHSSKSNYIQLNQKAQVMHSMSTAPVLPSMENVSSTKQTASAFGEMSPEDTSRYNQYWDDVANRLDTDARVQLNQWRIRPDASLYTKYKTVYTNPKYFNQETGNMHWPPNDGFVAGTKKVETLSSGTQLDRYGNLKGSFLATKQDSYIQRSLAPHSEKARYYTFEVQKNFEITSGKIVPWFDQPGGGTQFIKYKPDDTAYKIKELIESRVIKIVQPNK